MILNLSESALEDSIVAIGFPICFYYGFTGIACIVYYRHELTKSVRDFILLGIAPLLGGLILFGVVVKATIYYGHAENVSSKPILGITLPLWMGIGGMLVGLILMIVSRPVLQGILLTPTRNGQARAVRGTGGARPRTLLRTAPTGGRAARRADWEGRAPVYRLAPGTQCYRHTKLTPRPRGTSPLIALIPVLAIASWIASPRSVSVHMFGAPVPGPSRCSG